MDDGLVLKERNIMNAKYKSLNPYCSGRWSRTRVFANNEGRQFIKS